LAGLFAIERHRDSRIPRPGSIGLAAGRHIEGERLSTAFQSRPVPRRLFPGLRQRR
jgi:hypothetical protein